MTTDKSGQTLRVGVGGPVGSGKTALLRALCSVLRDYYDIAVVTNDIYTKEDANFLGYRTDHFKVWLFVYSALIAALAGALYVPQVGIINPGEFSPVNSIEIVVWVAVGGRGTLYGAVVGAILVSYAKTRFTSLVPESWIFMLGALFVFVTIFLPKGLAGLLKQRRERDMDGDDNGDSRRVTGEAKA